MEDPAAILRHLLAGNRSLCPSGRMKAAGAGSKRFPGLANLLHAAVIELADDIGCNRIARLSFEIDDMSPEAISIGLERLRLAEGVRNFCYHTRFGKKGRSQFSVQILVQPEEVETLAQICFLETSTLDLRLDLDTRMILKHDERKVLVQGEALLAKYAEAARWCGDQQGGGRCAGERALSSSARDLGREGSEQAR